MRNKFFFGVFVVVVVLFFVFFVFPRVQAQVKPVEPIVDHSAGLVNVSGGIGVKQLNVRDVDVDVVPVDAGNAVAQIVRQAVPVRVVVSDGNDDVETGVVGAVAAI